MKSRRAWGAVVAVAAAVALGACASTGGGSGEPADRDVINRAQIEGMEHLSAMDIVRRLKPSWLRTGRGTDSLVPAMQSRRGVQVYLDGAHMGSVQELTQVSGRDIEEIRRLDPRQATVEFGTSNPDGAILILTR